MRVVIDPAPNGRFKDVHIEMVSLEGRQGLISLRLHSHSGKEDSLTVEVRASELKRAAEALS